MITVLNAGVRVIVLFGLVLGAGAAPPASTDVPAQEAADAPAAAIRWTI